MSRVTAFLLMFIFAMSSVTPVGAQTAPSKSATKPPLPVGTRRPILDVTTLKGNRHPSWSELNGKVVVIDFWATWCAPCLASFPKMNGLKSKMSSKPVEFLSISYETPGQVGPVLHKHPLETTVCLDNDFRTFRSFNAWGIPSVFVFDKKGVLAAVVYPEDASPALIQTVLDGGVPKVEQEKAWDDPTGAEASFRAMREKAVKEGQQH